MSVASAGNWRASPSRRSPRPRRSPSRGERNTDAQRERNGETARETNVEASQGDAPIERGQRNGREERAPRGERNEGRRERRNEGPTRSDEASVDAQAVDTGGPTGAGAIGEGQGSDAASRRDGEERRGRSRDRYGRDRRERGPREDAEVNQPAPVAPVAAQADDAIQVEVPPPVMARPERVEAPAVAPIVVEPKTAAPSSRALPKVQHFELPLDELAQVAEGSGLHWVNSDAQRVAQVRAAIAAEPKPVHVPRERSPAIVIDEGPLVLVETRRDLGSMVLPFEQQPGQDASARH